MPLDPDALYILVPVEASRSVLYRANKLHADGVTAVTWIAVLDSASSEEGVATIKLSPADVPTYQGYTLLGYSERTSGESMKSHPVAHFPNGLDNISIKATCDICETRRARYHFILRNETETISAGYSCLVKAGILPSERAFNNFFPSAVIDPRRPLSETLQRVMARPKFDTLECLAAAIADFRDRGYVSRQKQARSLNWIPTSAEKVNETMENRSSDYVPPAISDNLLAAAIMKTELLRGPSVNTSDFAQDALEVLKQGRVMASDFALVATLPLIYSRLGLAEESTENACKSDWVGEVGERLDLTCQVIRQTNLASSFGAPLKKFLLRSGDSSLFSWFTTVDLPIQEGQVVNLRGTVKRHDTYRGTKETVLTRCKIIP